MSDNKTLLSVLKYFDKYLTMDGANEIIINQPCIVEMDIRGKFVTFEDSNLDLHRLETFVSILATSRGERFDKDNTQLNTSIPNTKYRVTALHKRQLSGQDIQINIRIPPTTTFNLEDFKLSKNLKYTYEEIKQLVRDKHNILISGGTGTGKTGLLNALLKEINENERLVFVQDSDEIMSKNKNKTSILVSKRDNAKYTYRHGIDSATRLSPERLLLGELDTRNTLYFLRLSNTGHKGGISTVHANDVESCIDAISLNVQMEKQIDKNIIKEYIASAIDYIIQIQKNRETNEREIVDILNVKEYINKDKANNGERS
ncbi:ATPase, T2SS/T4P/T4SS family (plasmid) [Aliarcobacter butzleri]|uniref:ATPase, T2SS/T4P/T4SS family n=1 Tax=Aliarcobacter butzleri TaxID=28197 RepID=UPI0021B41488|nr:ATPase, T2SS/T4P/T4SS family [Aliarcobacter butzleri]UXC30718.1 ATPase, T2SS/T4P/T4SS family [Aliarcobacter butzleri]